MVRAPAADVTKRYVFGFLTDQWEWEAEFSLPTREQAKAEARAALEAVVREEAPTLACVTVFEDSVKVGVWDWVEAQPCWTGT